MTEEQIIRALECCKNDDCDNCPNTFGNCYANLAGYALDIINRQQEKLKVQANNIHALIKMKDVEMQRIKAEAIKEFVEKLKDMSDVWEDDEFYFKYVTTEQIDNLVKEMRADNEQV